MSKKKSDPASADAKFGTVNPEEVIINPDGVFAAATPAVEPPPEPPPPPPLPPAAATAWLKEDAFIAVIRAAYPAGFIGEHDVVLIHLLRNRARQNPPFLASRRHKEHGWWEYEAPVPFPREAAERLAAFLAEIRLNNR